MLVPLAAVTRMVGVPESLPLLEVEDLDVLPSPQPANNVNAPKNIMPWLSDFFKLLIFFPIYAVSDKRLRFFATNQTKPTVIMTIGTLNHKHLPSRNRESCLNCAVEMLDASGVQYVEK